MSSTRGRKFYFSETPLKFSIFTNLPLSSSFPFLPSSALCWSRGAPPPLTAAPPARQLLSAASTLASSAAALALPSGSPPRTPRPLEAPPGRQLLAAVASAEALLSLSYPLLSLECARPARTRSLSLTRTRSQPRILYSSPRARSPDPLLLRRVPARRGPPPSTTHCPQRPPGELPCSLLELAHLFPPSIPHRNHLAAEHPPRRRKARRRATPSALPP